MNNKTTCSKQDVVVNFKDLMLYILLRWRSILVCIVAFTVLAGGFKYLIDYKGYKANVAAAEQTESTKTDLDEIELSNVKTVVSYKNMLKAQAAYINSSPYMQLDPNDIHSMNISYVLTGRETLSAASLYAQHIQSSTLYETIKTKLDLSYSSSYLSEIITVSVAYPENVFVESGDKSVLNITVYAADEQQCRAISNAVTDYISTFGDYFNDSGITLSSPYTDYAVICNSDIGTAQQKAITSYTTYKKNYQDSLEALTNTERAYYDSLQQADVAVSDIAAPSISKKFLVLGFALGLLLPCGIYLLAYLFGRRVKSADDFKLRYGSLTLFGTVKNGDGKKRNIIDRFIIRLVRGKTADNGFEGLSARKVALAVEQNGYKNIHIVGTASARESVLSNLTDSGITVTDSALPETDADAFDAVKNADAVLIAAASGTTYYNEVYSIIEFCGTLNKPVLGAIVVE